MSTLTPSAVDASTRLLRVLSLLTAQLDPAKGIKATTLKALAEDVEDIRKEYEESLSSVVEQLLVNVVYSLSFPATSTAPYADCVFVIRCLHQLLDLLLVPPSPPRPSPFLRLPAELVAHIVEFCQTDDLRLRQNTNLALSRTCRLFHRVVSPILNAEMHLFTASQLERAAEKVAQSKPHRLAITALTCDLPVAEIRRQDSGQWAGRRLLPLLLELHRRSDLRILALDFKADLNRQPSWIGHDEDLSRALGVSEHDWPYHFFVPFEKLEEVHLPIASPDHPHLMTFSVLAGRTKWLKRFSLGRSSTPYYLDADTATSFLSRGDPVEPKFSALTVFAAPFLTLYPAVALQLFRPLSPTSPSPLRHLELSLHMADPGQDLVPLAELLAHLSPSLRRLALRIQCPAHVYDHHATEESLVDAFAECALLEHLEIGVEGMGPRTAVRTLERLPRLRHVILLPTAPLRAYSNLQQLLSLFLRTSSITSLTSFTICTPREMEDLSDVLYGEEDLRKWAEVCEEKRIELVVDPRPLECEWVAQ
ncbi:hypothetical protein JCM8097_008811 [Rhodosporidiobolus ruineniae]